MKKLIIIVFSLLLASCTTSKYGIYINELNNATNSSENIPISINIETEKITDDLYVYRALIDKNEEVMNQVVALLIHNKETENAFPSIGIYDEKINVNNEKGIKLSGYVESIEDIEYKLYIEYINKDNEKKEYYYISTNSIDE